MNISSLQTNYLNLDISSGFYRDIEGEHDVQTECTFCGGINNYAEQCFKRIRKEKEKARAVDVSFNRQVEHTPRKCFRCGSEDHMIAKCPNSQKDIEKQRKQVRLNKKDNCACNNSENNDDQKIYTSMA